MTIDGVRLRGVRCVLVNPHLHPVDLRGEVQSTTDGDKHESGMNFGLLVVANALVRAGAEVEIVDLQAPHAKWQEAISAAIARGPTRVVGVGTLSVYSFLPLVEILRLVRDLEPEIMTVAGGQNAQNLPQLLRAAGATELVDYLVCGDGEHAIVEVVRAIVDGDAPLPVGVTRLAAGQVHVPAFTERLPLDEANSFLDYSLYPRFRHLWPVIEESRGCPYRCDFCANSLQGGANIRVKAPELLAAEVQHLYDAYGATGTLPTVLMTSIFGVKANVARTFFEHLDRTGLEPRFVASTRVDLRHEVYLPVGAKYFDQMHFGLESGSLEVIGRMVKTANARHYLSRAETTLATWHDHGVHTGTNFIVGYLGETRRTVEESIEWLASNRRNISSVWGGGLMAYPDSPLSKHFERYIKQYGASYEVVSAYCEALQTWPVNPSAELRYRDVLRYVDRVHELFFDARSFYHHYKWYVGPRTEGDSTSFLPQSDFEKRFKLATSAVGEQ